MDTDFQAMFEELRAQFQRRIPGGLTFETNDRLRRILESESSGRKDKQDILRRSYDSMMSWMKREEPTSVQQKDVLQPHEDTVKYREVEYNVVVNSKDRNWILNKNQNRYNFTVQFNTNFRPQGSGYQAIVNTRIRNITRIEFIKAILPVEGLSTPILLDASSQPHLGFDSVLSLPSVTVNVDEFTGNNYGTSNDIDKSLAICQYDATWRSDCRNRGYSLFFPKFMKAQRVYSPTPLANLQALSFQLQDPQGNLLSSSPDSSVLNGIYMGSQLPGSVYSTDAYIFLKTVDYFPQWGYSQLDKVFVQGISTDTTFSEWLQGPEGHPVVGTAWIDLSGNMKDGANSVGYANWIILPNNLEDPEFISYTFSTTDVMDLYFTNASILNLSRQVQLYIRLITREYDLVSSVRADNV